jgi:hypothetical protein
MAQYRGSTPEDQRKFDRWLSATAAVASIFALALLAIALKSTGLPGPEAASADSGARATTGSVERSNSELSAHELMIRLGRDLPVRQTADPF